MAEWLNGNGIKTKNIAGKWDRPTVYKILKWQIGPRGG